MHHQQPTNQPSMAAAAGTCCRPGAGPLLTAAPPDCASTTGRPGPRNCAPPRRRPRGATRAVTRCAWRGGSWILPPHPDPVLFPRKTLDMKFAVLLMRSAYEAVDALDFIPMDKFQVKVGSLGSLSVVLSGE